MVSSLSPALENRALELTYTMAGFPEGHKGAEMVPESPNDADGRRAGNGVKV